jgi:hypothetical protein
VAVPFLVEIYLPGETRDRQDAQATFDAIRAELTERYGGVTAFMRAPALGLWKDPQGEVEEDEIVILEVIVKTLDQAWWRDYRMQLEDRLKQESIVVHATAIETL